MKLISHFKSIVLNQLLAVLLILSATYVSAQTQDSKVKDFIQNQSSIISQQIENYFDTEKPGYYSVERENELYSIDAITHNPKPHNNAIKDLFFNRYKKSLESIKNTEVESGVVVWNIYNMSYIVKTESITVAFDLVLLPDCMIKEGELKSHEKVLTEIVKLCNILFVSHNHEDHFDNFVAQEFLSLNKPVIAQKDIFRDKDFYNKITHLRSDGKEIEFAISEIDEKIELRIYPGHQAIAADAAIDDNFTVLTFPNNITVAHSGDQSWKADFSWLDTIKNDVDIDILMINTWTLSPDRLAKGLDPEIILPGHMNEMDHSILGRIPYWKSYQFWRNSKEKTIHLFWGEPYFYNK